MTKIIKHGMSHHRVYTAWCAMKTRCYNKNIHNYHSYGGKGIVVCDEWRNNFMAFYDYVTNLLNYGISGYSLDRKDNDGNYEPGNVRWTSPNIQGANRAMQSNNTSGYVGVYQVGLKWMALIKVRKKSVYLGIYEDILDALDARNKYIIENNLTEYKIQKQ